MPGEYRMTMTSSINSALSALSIIEQRMGIASANISNAGVTGYTEKSLGLATDVSQGQAIGVLSTGVVDTANANLQKQIATSTSTSSAASTNNDYYSQLDQIMGTLQSVTTSSTAGTGLSASLNTLESDLTSLASSPDQVSLKQQVVSDLTSFTTLLQQTSSSVQNMRTQADQQISTNITTVNSTLDTIATLNGGIASAVAAGQPSGDLQDQQNEALQKLSGLMNITYYTDANGAAHVFSGNATLIDGPTVNTLSHVASSDLAASTYYNAANTGGVSAIDAGGVDITSQITSGSIGALINQRDTVLPNVQSELDMLSSTLKVAVNNASNQGTSSSTTNSLVGQVNISGAAAPTITVGAGGATIRVASLNNDGSIYKYADITLPAGGITAAQIVTDINAQTATSGITATLNATTGAYTLSAAGGYGVAIGTASGTVTGTRTLSANAAGTATTTQTFSNVSAVFGFNDLMIDGSSTSSSNDTTIVGSSSSIEVNSTLVNDPALLPAGALNTGAVVSGLSQLTVTGQTSGTPTTNAGVNGGDGSIATALASALSSTQSFAAAGNIAAGSQSLTEYSQALISGVSSQVAAASTTSTTTNNITSNLQTQYSNQTGVNVDQQMSLLTQLQNAYSSAAQVLSTEKAMFQVLLTAVQAT